MSTRKAQVTDVLQMASLSAAKRAEYETYQPVFWHRAAKADEQQQPFFETLVQENRDTGAAKRFFRRLIDDQELPERIVTDRLRSYGAALRELPELNASEYVTVSAAERQNNLIEQSHRPTREQERQQRGFRGLRCSQGFLFTHAEVGNLFRPTRAGVCARLRRRNLTRGFGLWAELSCSMP